MAIFEWDALFFRTFLAKGVDGCGSRAYSSPPQLMQRTKQRKRNGSGEDDAAASTAL